MRPHHVAEEVERFLFRVDDAVGEFDAVLVEVEFHFQRVGLHVVGEFYVRNLSFRMHHAVPE